MLRAAGSTYIIAEAGVNHDGNMEDALSLVDAATDAGADCVKFQLFSAARLLQPELARLELSPHDIAVLMDYAESVGIDFLCTPFSVPDAAALMGMGLETVKLSSRSVTDEPLLTFCAQNFEHVILSVGNPWGEPRSITEIGRAVGILGGPTLLHCVSKYPTPPEEADLDGIRRLQRIVESVGYSDHTLGSIAPVAAVVLGVVVLEKHLTLDTSREGADHHMSADPRTFADMVDAVREVERMLG